VTGFAPTAASEQLGSEVGYGFVSLESEPNAYHESLLDEQERDRARRLVREVDRRRYVLAHAALRLLLARYLSLDPGRVRYEYGGRGKPKLARGLPPLEFNLSHSHCCCLIGLAWKRPLGVDLERVRPIAGALRIAEDQFTHAEAATIRATAPADRDEAFLHCWTRKEAVFKADGEGLARRLDSTEVDFAPGAASAVRGFDETSSAGSGWYLRDLPAPAGHIAAGAAATAAGAPAPAWRRLAWPEMGHPCDEARPGTVRLLVSEAGGVSKRTRVIRR
jgi:4'-phosphopantetheinyl transferase